MFYPFDLQILRMALYQLQQLFFDICTVNSHMKNKAIKHLTYDEQKVKCEEFLINFQDNQADLDQIYGRKKYLVQLQNVANGDLSCVQILYEDLDDYFRRQQESEMVRGFKANTKRYINIFSQIIDKIMPKKNKLINPDDEIIERFQNILEEQRRDNLQTQIGQIPKSEQKIPASCHQKFDVAIIYGPETKAKPKIISDMKAQDIGSLVICKAIVVRASAVKPEIVVACYACDVCGCEIYQQILDSSFKPLTVCSSNKCRDNKVSGKLTFLPGFSKFKTYQQLRIQETSDQLKPGSIPRSLTVYLKGSSVKQASPGDMILIQGILVPSKKNNFKDQFEIKFNCHIQALKIIREKKKYIQMGLTEQQQQKVLSVRSSIEEHTLFNKMSQSIAPQIYGLSYVKKALLLLLTGGVTKQTHDKLKIRGQINIALIGDPGIAKSQLLKHISRLAPRAVYTTGKGSSGVGLTAAIVTDPSTKQLSLEAGALVLADMGICCIDEFDKMDQYDRTAIHQVMQQQTVSIAKAGITSTLNARTSILAAANPLYGRYNKNQSPHKNINLPAALLSRFDLIFILIDEVDKTKDLELAKHIGMVHQGKESQNVGMFETQFIRTYIAMAKQFDPIIPPNLHQQLVARYIEKRKEQSDISREGQNYTTTRSLLALIRLCQARAKLRFSNEVSKEDIDECLQIQQESQKTVTPERFIHKPLTDFMSSIYGIIKDICKYNTSKSQSIDKIQKRVFSRGYSPQQLQQTLKEYEAKNLIMLSNNEILLIN